MNEAMLIASCVDYCENLLAMRRSGDWKPRTWDGYCKDVLGISKTRAKLLCGFATFRRLVEQEMADGALPSFPEQVKAILSLPQKRWLEAWAFVITDHLPPILPQNVESTLKRFGMFARKAPPAEVRKKMQFARAAKTFADFGDGAQLVAEIGTDLGTRWDKAVEVVIDADQARRTHGQE